MQTPVLAPSTPPTTPKLHIVTDLSDNGSIVTTDNAENQNSSSGDFLKMDAKGLCGLLERLPMCFKLSVLVLSAICIIALFAIWIIVLQAIELNKESVIRTFNQDYEKVSLLTNALQRERGAMANYYSTPTSTSLRTAYTAAQDTTNQALTNWLSFKRQLTNTQQAELDTKETQLQEARKNVLIENPLDTFLFYTSYAETLLDAIGVRAVETQNQQVILTNSMFLRLREYAGKLRSFGIIAFGNKNSTLSPILYTQFVSFVAAREAQKTTWLGLSPASTQQLYKTYVTSLPEFANVSRLETIAVASYQNFSSSVNDKTWYALMTVLVNGYQTIFTALQQAADAETQKELAIDITIIVIIIALVALSAVAFTILSVCFGSSIIGPWRRLNILQETIIYKLVPRSFLKAVNCASITDVKYGKLATKHMALMKICLRNFWGNDKISGEERLRRISKFWDVTHPLIISSGGFISNTTADTMDCCFPQTSYAIKCGTKIVEALNDYHEKNSSEPAFLISIAIHSAAQVEIGVVGDESRIAPVIVSKHAHDLDHIAGVAKRFQVQLAISGDSLSLLDNPIKSIQLIGKVANEFDVFEIALTSDKKKHRDIMSGAVKAFNEYNFVDAGKYFEQLETTENAVAASLYKIACTQASNDAQRDIMFMKVEEALNNPALFVYMEEFCKKEMNDENLQAWKLIQKYKRAKNNEDRVTVAHKLRDDYFSQEHDLNVNVTMRQAVVQQISQASFTPNLFDKIESELQMLIHDAFHRMRNTDGFKKRFFKDRQMVSPLMQEVLRNVK